LPASPGLRWTVRGFEQTLKSLSIRGCFLIFTATTEILSLGLLNPASFGREKDSRTSEAPAAPL
jgi:hypothetical protein